MKSNFKIPLIALYIVILIGSHGYSQKHPEDKLGWKLGAQAYTFNRYTFFEAIEKIDSCDLQYVEAFPSQKVGGGIDGTMDYHMDDKKRKEILKKLKSNGVQMISYGVVSPSTETDWHQLLKVRRLCFSFAHEGPERKKKKNS